MSHKKEPSLLKARELEQKILDQAEKHAQEKAELTKTVEALEKMIRKVLRENSEHRDMMATLKGRIKGEIRVMSSV